VGLRYADAPAVLDVSQIIAAYTFDATGGATLNSRPDPGGSLAQATGTIAYSNHPTFTFTPATGEAYANAYIRPLPPTLVLPLAQSGIPIDLLLRITVQSVGGLQNGTMLGGPNGNGSPEFFELLQVLRRLQLSGELSIQYRAGQVSLALAPAKDAQADPGGQDLARARSLLGLSSAPRSYAFAYGSAAAGTETIPIVTRSVLGILSDVGAEIAVPDADVEGGATKPTISLVGGETRPIIVIHVGKKAPESAYVAVAYGDSRYWIDRSDFDSKYAFTVLQDLMALAQANDNAKVPLVTIPAN
jgi:hypothetical protein